jgi:hypothetical protein
MNDTSYVTDYSRDVGLNRFLPDRFILEYKVNGETRRWTAPIWPPNLRATLGQALAQGAGLVSNIARRRR